MNHLAPQQIRLIGFFYRKQKLIRQLNLTNSEHTSTVQHMDIIKTPKIIARIEGNELVLTHRSGGQVRIPLKRLENWLIRQFRQEL